MIIKLSLIGNLINANINFTPQCDSFRENYTVKIKNNDFDFKEQDVIYELRNNDGLVEFSISKDIKPIYDFVSNNIEHTSPIHVDGKTLTFIMSTKKALTNAIKKKDFQTLMNNEKLFVYIKDKDTRTILFMTNHKEPWDKAQEECQTQIDNSERQHIINVALKLSLYIGGFIFFIFVIYKIIEIVSPLLKTLIPIILIGVVAIGFLFLILWWVGLAIELLYFSLPVIGIFLVVLFVISVFSKK